MDHFYIQKWGLRFELKG